MQLADAALYRAKEAGRDQWLWAEPSDRPTESNERPPSQFVDHYLDDAVGGVIVELLAAAQREVGERWHRNELTVADEHIAIGVSAAALDALVSEVRPLAGDGHTVVPRLVAATTDQSRCPSNSAAG